MKILYDPNRLKKIFESAVTLKKRLGPKLAVAVLKRIRELEQYVTFEDCLSIKAGKVRRLQGWPNYSYALNVTANVRLIIEVEAESDYAVKDATCCVVKGVGDYHGDNKVNWSIS